MVQGQTILLSILALVVCVLALAAIFYVPNYIQKEGIKAGLTKEEIEKWQTKAVLYGGLFVIYFFKKELKRRANNKPFLRQ